MKIKGCSIYMYILFFVFSLAVAFPSPVSAAEEKIVAKVNGVPITARQLESAIDEYIPRAFFHGNISPEKRMEFKPKALDTLVNKELYYQAAKKDEYSVERAEIDAAVKKIKDRFKGKGEFEQVLKSSGLTIKTLEAGLERELLISKFVNKEIVAKSRVSDSDLSGYYEKNKGTFLKPESFRMRHILISVPPSASKEEREKLRKDALDVLEKARKGEDFGELAYKYSHDDWRVKGGDLGLVHRGRLEPELEDAGYKLEKGQISDLIETLSGYHILKLEEKFPATQLTFDEVRDKLRKQLEAARKKELEENILKGLKENARIEIF